MNQTRFLKASIIAAVALLLSTVVINTGCKQKDPSIDVTTGGKGGAAVLRVTPEHEGGFVDSCKIYIKYATNDAPANGRYDDSAWCVMQDTTPVATFTNLKVGGYYILGDGYHLPYVPATVKGGLPFNFTTEDTVHLFLPTYQYIK